MQVFAVPEGFWPKTLYVAIPNASNCLRPSDLGWLLLFFLIFALQDCNTVALVDHAEKTPTEN